MLTFLADENFDGRVLKALAEHAPELDIIRVQDVGLRTKDDPDIQEYAARENRILLTHDVRTMAHFSYERAAQGLPMPGVVEIKRRVRIQLIVEELRLLAGASLPGEMEGRVEYIPLA
jgi:predicted nuclease of predicted toxin-antitoxin system